VTASGDGPSGVACPWTRIPAQRAAGRHASEGHAAALSAGDPATAASHFNGLTLATPLEEAMLTGSNHPRSPNDLDKHAHAAVRAFLNAYRPH
jgi:hypothetical protein